MTEKDFSKLGVKREPKTKKVAYSIDIEVLEQFNNLAKAKNYNKSQTINNLIKVFIEKESSLV